jgi:FKBP-type peptidyl-prolyl cis-trans isomerase FkpA
MRRFWHKFAVCYDSPMPSLSQEKQNGQAYLDKAAEQPGAKRTTSGLLYVPITEGSGASPTPADRVKVHYTGKLIDGTVFDSSVRRGQPATFGLNQIIACWQEGLQLMRAGGKARIVSPSKLAYGDSGAPPDIPPGATLDFEIELLEVLPAKGRR